MSTGGGATNYGGTLTLTASSINCKGTLFGWDSTAVAYMDVVSRINCILTNLQQVNTMLTAAMDTEDTLAKQVFNQTAGQGSGLGAEFGMTGLLKYLTYRGLKQRIVNDSKTTFPTNTTSCVLSCMNDTYLKETVYNFNTGVPLPRSGMVNDVTPTQAYDTNLAIDFQQYAPDLSKTSYLLEYLRAHYTPKACYNHGHPLDDLQAQANVLGANASIATTGYEYCVVNDETSAGVAARGNVYLGKVSDFVTYIVANKYHITNYSTKAVNDLVYYPHCSYNSGYSAQSC